MAVLVKSRCRTDSGYRAAARVWLLSASSSPTARQDEGQKMAGRLNTRRSQEAGCRCWPSLPWWWKEGTFASDLGGCETLSQFSATFSVSVVNFRTCWAAAGSVDTEVGGCRYRL